MQEIVYHKNYELENTYWWFVVRNQIIKKVIIELIDLSKDDYVLDVGCGTGGFAKELLDYAQLICLDTNDLALEYTRKRGIKNTFNCLLQDFPVVKYNPKIITFLDVIEHIEDDNQVVNSAYQSLNIGSYVVATVPAYQWLWSKHDEIHMHYRRYNLKQLKKLFRENGFHIVYASYFNTILFPIATLKRFIDKLTGSDKKNNEPIDEVSPIMNSILKSLFSIEKKFLPKIFFPFGLSIILVAKKLQK